MCGDALRGRHAPRSESVSPDGIGVAVEVEVNVRQVALPLVADAARLLEQAGVDVVADSEVRRDPFLTMAVMAGVTDEIHLATAISLAFTKSPMVYAYSARNLNELARGRFHLGLGTQVKQHVIRRFSSEWGRPGPHLEDCVVAIRDIWRSWETGERLDHQSTHYSIDLMTPEFDLGPDPNGAIPIEIAAVNSYNIGVAARLADGIRLHAFSTAAYIRDVIRPMVEHEVVKAGRSLDAVRLIGGGFIATGDSEQSVEAAREAARRRIGFYGSTRTYRPVLEHHGWGSLGEELRRIADAGDWDRLAAAVPDEVLEAFVCSGTYTEIVPELAKRYQGTIDRVQLPWPGGENGNVFDRDHFRDFVAEIHALSPAD